MHLQKCAPDNLPKLIYNVSKKKKHQYNFNIKGEKYIFSLFKYSFV